MRYVLLLSMVLTLWMSLSVQANCRLSDVQIERLTLAFDVALTKPTMSCNQNTLSIFFPAQNNATSLTLAVPFDLFEENYQFQGFAKYYNGSRMIEFNNWRGWKGRYLAFLASADNADLVLHDKTLQINWDANTQVTITIYLGLAQEEFAPIQYSYLWSWLAALCQVIQAFLLMLGDFLNHNWGIAIILLAVLFKLACMPLQIWALNIQNKIDYCEAVLKPKLKQIKSQYDGLEAHQRIMAEYKQLGITPFYSMKAFITPLIQLPIQIAIFNVLGDMPQLAGACLWWINNLAYPDTIVFSGYELNVLPCLMTVLTIVSTKKYGLYLMAILFLILFYPFPSAMVLFWTMMNVLYLVFSHLVKWYRQYYKV